MYNYLSMLISIIISAIAILIAFRNISPYRLRVKEYIIMAVIIIAGYLMIYLFNTNLASMPAYIVPIIFIYKKSHKLMESIIMGIIVTIVIAVVDNFIGNLIISILSESFVESQIGYYIGALAILLVLYPVSKFVGKILAKYREFIVENYKSKYFILIYVTLILTFGLFYVNINWNKSSSPVYLTKINGIIFMTYVIIMVCVFIAVLFMMKKEEKFKCKQMQLDNLKEYTENVEKLYMDMCKFRHDYINIISTMATFIEERDIDGLENHFNNHIYPLNRKINNNNYRLGLLKNIELSEIKSLISAKVIRAQELGLEIVIDIAEPITKINMDIIDLSRCLGIVFDNAIEASLESAEKFVNIAFINKEEFIVIVVTNSFKGDVHSPSLLFKDGFSTKGKNRGLGLGNLKNILGKYGDLILDTYIEQGKFVQEISINKK